MSAMMMQDNMEAIAPISILVEEDGPAYSVTNETGKNRVILVCEHASNRVPRELNQLGLSEDQLQSHIAWDPGASDLAQLLSSALDATLIEARFSRLVYDCNRPPEAVSVMPAKTEFCDVPGNQDIGVADRLSRTCDIYLPFHGEFARLIATKRARGIAPVIVTIHSFTPVFNGETRNVEIGYLHGDDKRLAEAMLSVSSKSTRYDIRLNQPYGPTDGVLHSIEKQNDDTDIPYVMIEVRNDLLTSNDNRENIYALLSNSISEAVSSLDSDQQILHTGNL